MPSASNAKAEKPQVQSVPAPPPDQASKNDSPQNNPPIRQAVRIIEHKIRNLEKRKLKLETYRALQIAGKDLNQDQKVAVAKYDEVTQTLEFAKDLCKQFHCIITTSEKEAKKLARKEAIERTKQDLQKIREVILIQDVLTQMGIDDVREDFLLGRNGATQITAENLKVLDELYPLVSPKHASELAATTETIPLDFKAQVQTAAEHLLAIVDNKTKEILGTTYSHIKDIVKAIQGCDYLERSTVQEEAVVSNETELFNENNTNVVDEVQPNPLEANISPETYANHTNVEPPTDHIVPPPDQMPPMPNFPPVPQELNNATHSLSSQHGPDPVHHQYYQQQMLQQQQQPPTQQQPRPITEVIGSGSFFFLQESEIEATPAEILSQQQPGAVSLGSGAGVPSAIPTQTFTNQNFGQAMPPNIQSQQSGNVYASQGVVYPQPSAVNAPPPIPMPPSHVLPAGNAPPPSKMLTSAQLESTTYQNSEQQYSKNEQQFTASNNYENHNVSSQKSLSRANETPIDVWSAEPSANDEHFVQQRHGGGSHRNQYSTRTSNGGGGGNRGANRPPGNESRGYYQNNYIKDGGYHSNNGYGGGGGNNGGFKPRNNFGPGGNRQSGGDRKGFGEKNDRERNDRGERSDRTKSSGGGGGGYYRNNRNVAAQH